jgi:aldose 1-epimerase
VIGERQIDGLDAHTLTSQAGELEVAYVPDAGMVACSLLHHGEELLGQRGGLARYARERSTMGIPLLYPWANRVSARRFEVAGREVNLDAHPELVQTDPSGLPIHGLLSAASGWRVERHEATEEGGVLVASFDFGAHPELSEAFPFPHELTIQAMLSDATLRIETTVRATGGTEVPVAFGYHPYLRLPGAKRSEWLLEAPVSERVDLDERKMPTGKRHPVLIEPGPLGSRTFDDEFVAPANATPLALSGGGRRIEVSLGEGYAFTQVYAPDDDDVVALEPMTAPTNALVAGGSELALVPVGETFRAEFSITVSG